MSSYYWPFHFFFFFSRVKAVKNNQFWWFSFSGRTDFSPLYAGKPWISPHDCFSCFWLYFLFVKHEEVRKAAKMRKKKNKNFFLSLEARTEHRLLCSLSRAPSATPDSELLPGPQRCTLTTRISLQRNQSCKRTEDEGWTWIWHQKKWLLFVSL